MMRCDDVYTTILDFNKHIPIHNIHMVVDHRWSENPKPLNLARKKGLFRDLGSKIKKSATTSGLSDRDGNQRFEPVVRLFNWLGSGRFNIRHWMMVWEKLQSWLILTWFLMSNSDFQGFDFRNMHMTYPVRSGWFYRVMFTYKWITFFVPSTVQSRKRRESGWADGLKRNANG